MYLSICTHIKYINKYMNQLILLRFIANFSTSLHFSLRKATWQNKTIN